MLDDLDERQRNRLRAKLARGCPARQVADEFGYSVSSVYQFMQAEGIPRRGRHLWTAYEDELVRRYYPAHGGAWDGWARLMPERRPSRNTVTWRAMKLRVRYEGREHGGMKGAT